MNQILVREKLYVTPELKRKKKIYKCGFFISIFLICILFSGYIYSCYDRKKGQEVSYMLLENADFGENQREEISLEEKMLIISISKEDEYIVENNNTEIESKINFNQDEIIANADKYVTASGDTYSIIARINIPKINLEYTILSKTTVELLKMSPCKFWGVNPNEIGNLSIAAHNYRRKGIFFSDVPSLTIGDVIKITDLTKRTIEYSVYDKYEVDPNDTSCTNPETDGTREITLITCNNNSSKRVIIKAREIQ